MKKTVIFLIGLFLLIGCSNSTEAFHVDIYQSQLPEVISFWNRGTVIDTNGDLYTWGYDGRNIGESLGSLGQGTEVVYNNIPTKIFAGVVYTDSGGRGLTKNGEIIEWGKRRENDSCVPEIIKENVAKVSYFLYLTQDGELYSIPEYENIRLSVLYESSSQLIMKEVKDFSNRYALKNDGSLWTFRVDSATAEILKKPEKLMDHVEKIFASSMVNGVDLFLKDDKTLWSYNGNEFGQCGNGEHGDLDVTTNDCMVTEPFLMADNVIDAWAADFSAFYITDDNKLYACGENDYDMMLTGGNEQMDLDNYPEYVTTPILVMENVKQVVGCRDNDVFVVKTDNTLWSWGNADTGTLGNGIFYESATDFNTDLFDRWMSGEALYCQPTQIMENVDRLYTETAGLHFAVKTDGSVWYWGYGSIFVDEDDVWDRENHIQNVGGEITASYEKHYIIPTPIEFSVETFFRNALDSIAAREGIDTTQYQAVRYKDQ